MESLEMAKYIAAVVDSKKAKDIKILEIKDISSIGDYFVICSGGSTTQVKALSNEIEEKLKEKGFEPTHREGYSSSSWVLLDYSQVIVHIFLEETRQFYSMERLWGEAKGIEFEPIDNSITERTEDNEGI